MRIGLFMIIASLLGTGSIDAQSALMLTRSRSAIQQAEAGVYYKFGKITVEGAMVFSPEQIVRIAGIKSNQMAATNVIDKAGDLIEREYLNRGHLRVEVKVIPDYQVISPRIRQGLVAVAIRILEGPVFTTRRVELVGNDTTRDKTVRGRMLLREGQTYSQELMDKSLQRINGLGRFEKITMADVKRDLDDDRGAVDLVIHLKEKAH
jgi:outer membrane protein assembly factor BamA